MTYHLLLIVGCLASIFTGAALGQCGSCPSDHACCLSQASNQWSCCPSASQPSGSQQSAPWNFNPQIKYDSYIWDCTPSTQDPAQVYTNISCLLDGRWSLNRLTFQLRSIPANGLRVIEGNYTMQNGFTQKVSFQADAQWALTVPVDKNEHAGVYDKIRFQYGGFDYTYHFGYGPYPHCPRC